MKKKIGMKNIIISLIIMLIIMLPSMAFASDMTNGVNINRGLSNIVEGPGNTILGIIRVFGIVASVAVLMVLGIKYMLGSVEEKAEYKKSLPIYFIGCFLVFGISAFLNVIYNLIEEIF